MLINIITNLALTIYQKVTLLGLHKKSLVINSTIFVAVAYSKFLKL